MLVEISLAVGIAGFIVGVVGAIFGYLGWRSDRKRIEIETYVRATMDVISKALAQIGKRADVAKNHFDKIHKDTLTIPAEDVRQGVNTHAKDGRSDVNAIVDARAIIQKQLNVLRNRDKSSKEVK